MGHDPYMLTEEMLVERERAEAATVGPVSVAEARQILSRFNASHWNNPGEHARYTIPADPKRDDDIRMLAFIVQTTEHIATLEAARKALGAILAEYDHNLDDGPDTVLDRIKQIATAALAQPGGGGTGRNPTCPHCCTREHAQDDVAACDKVRTRKIRERRRSKP